MGRTPEDKTAQPELRCWFCAQKFSPKEVVRDGILRSRVEEAGGPYRLHVCPECTRENVCERTPAGRWFSSPNAKLGFFDYFFSHFIDAGTSAENFLAAASWFREHEERRRYFFEREGDFRYSGGSFLRRFWPSFKQPPEPEKKRPQASRERASRARASRAGASSARGGKKRAPAVPERGRLVTPHEILGVPAAASEAEIREAFHRLAIHYHPDKARHLGEDFERVAEEKFIILKEAYDALLARRRKR